MAARRSGPVPGSRAASDRSPSAVRSPRFTIKASKQTCWVLGGTMGLLLVGSVLLYSWQSSQMAEIQKQVDEKNNEVASGQKIAAQLVQVEQDYNSTLGQLKFLETSVNENQYVPTLLHQMEGLAKSTNLQVNSVRPTFEYAPRPDPKKKQEDGDKKTPPPPPYDMIHIDMDIRGKYWNVAKMCYRLTEFPKIMQVDTMQLSPQQANGAGRQSPPLGVRLRLTGFIFPNDGSAEAARALQPLTPAGPSVIQPSPAPGASPAATQERAMAPAAATKAAHGRGV